MLAMPGRTRNSTITAIRTVMMIPAELLRTPTADPAAAVAATPAPT